MQIVQSIRESMETTFGLAVVEQDRDLRMIEQAREGSKSAFDLLFDEHKPFVYNVCYRMLGSVDDAIDATQAAFIQAYKSIRKFRGDAAFRSWLYRIAINVCTGMLRRERTQRTIVAESLDVATERMSDDAVWEAMLELRPDLRAILVLFYFQDLSCEEVAEALGCSAGAARTRLHRARVAFKRKYEEIYR
jgi:RNA polymerase sigma-70 factor, ECF subfamily